MLTAKLLVAAGAPLQLSEGETLPPVQPKPLNTCSLAMVAPSLISALVTVISCACAACAPSTVTASAAINFVAANFVIGIPPSVSRDFLYASRCGLPLQIFALARKGAVAAIRP